MKPENWQRIEDLFYQAADLAPAERAGFLRRECGENVALARHIEELIAAEDEAARFLEGAVRKSAEDAAQQLADGSGCQPAEGEKFGPYRIVRELGHGGMGDVYLAERADGEFEMQVALKLIRSDASPQRLVARFQVERQILAGLRHPGIAHLLDGGTVDGSPFLAMEYVAGEPIDYYCRERGLSIRERLRLFQAVCSAVAYAHAHLVVHRDIKPGNILVTAEGAPKLLDFGIAKILKEEQGADGLTRPLERVMTPAYASPEVVRGERVTTAADIYSLGALLYELLSGRAPFQLKSSLASEVERVICSEEPARPGALDRRLRGDLENIIRMAMHKEPARRYASVEHLMADVNRYLTGYPVAARSDAWYRMRKFAGRNRAALAAGGLAMAGVVGWLIAMRAEQMRTQRGFAQVRELAESLLFETDDALRPVSGATAARAAIVRRGLKYLDGLAREGGSDPKLEDELADAYARVADIQYSGGPNLGQPAGALESCRKGLGIRRALAAREPDNVDVERKLATDYLREASLLQNQGGAADESLRAGSAILDQLARKLPQSAAVRMDLALLYQNEGRRQAAMANFAASRALLEKARELGRAAVQGDSGNGEAQRRLALIDQSLLETLGGNRYEVAAADRAAGGEIFQEGERILTALARSGPLDLGTRAALVSFYTRGCGLTGLLDDPPQIEACRNAAIFADQLSGADRADVQARIAAINAHHNLSGRLHERGDRSSMAELRRAVELADELFAEKPDVIAIRIITALEHQQLGLSLLRLNRAADARTQVGKAIEMRAPLLLNPEDTRPRMHQAAAYMLLGEIEGHRRNWRIAAAAYQASVALYEPFEREHKLEPRSAHDLVEARRRAAECEAQSRRR